MLIVPMYDQSFGTEKVLFTERTAPKSQLEQTLKVVLKVLLQRLARFAGRIMWFGQFGPPKSLSLRMQWTFDRNLYAMLVKNRIDSLFRTLVTNEKVSDQGQSARLSIIGVTFYLVKNVSHHS
jgi:hypothetical protein